MMQAYKTEAKEKWGNTDAYREYAERTQNHSEQQWNALAQGMDEIMASFAQCMGNGKEPDSAEAQNLVGMLQNHITGNYYHCTKEILAGLGQMYVADRRFTQNIDKHAEGTAAFLCEAIGVYCSK